MGYWTGLSAVRRKQKRMTKEEDRPVLINRLVTTLGTSYVKKTWPRSDGGRCDGPAVAWRTVPGPLPLFFFLVFFSLLLLLRDTKSCIYLRGQRPDERNYGASRINSTRKNAKLVSLTFGEVSKVFRVSILMLINVRIHF